MKKFLPWVIGLAVGAALGVSGVYAVQRSWDDDESPACLAWSHYIDHWPTDSDGDIPTDGAKFGYAADKLDYWEKLLTIRNKACQ